MSMVYSLTAHNWQKMKKYIPHMSLPKNLSVEAVGLNNSNYTLKITILARV